MVAFYGESWRITNADVIDRTKIQYHFDGQSVTVAAGTSVMIAGEADPMNLTAADTAVVSWVVETGPASAGSLSLAAGMDPSWSMSPSAASQDLGSFDVAGEQRVVSQPMSVSVADLLAGDSQPTLRLDVTSGSVQIVQVKLRVWPPGGAGGSWVTGPAWERIDTTVARWYASHSEGTALFPPGAYSDAWEAEKSLVNAWDGQVVDYGPDFDPPPLTSSLGVGDVFISGEPGVTGFSSAGIALLSAVPGVAEPDPNIDYGVDPNEIRFETRAYIRGIGGGDALVEFAGWSDSSAVTVENTYLGAISLVAPPILWAHPTNPAFRVGPFRYPSAFTKLDGTIPLNTLGGQHLALGVMAPLYYEGPPTGNAVSDAGASIAGSLPFRVLISSYEYFDPAVVAQAPRFFVKDLDGVMRPVGFGKPAAETSVFRVPTAVGMYRDLTTTEYATYGPDSRPPGGYPLKVKRRDTDGADWWDHVGWMVPVAE